MLFSLGRTQGGLKRMISCQVTVAFLEGLEKRTKIIGRLVQLSPIRMQLGPITVCGNLIDNFHEK